jgi:hypothetical protein
MSRWRPLNYWLSANIEPIDGMETRRPVHRAIITITTEACRGAMGRPAHNPMCCYRPLIMHVLKYMRWQIQFVLAIMFFIIIPFKYAVLAIAGTDTTGKVSQKSTLCEHRQPVAPQPRVTAKYFIANVEQEVKGHGGFGNPEFCEISLGSTVEISYLQIPRTEYVFATMGDPKRIYFEFMIGGIFVNVAANLMLVSLIKRSKDRNSNSLSTF